MTQGIAKGLLASAGGKLAAAAAALLVLGGGVFVYGKTGGSDLVVKSGDRAYGINFDPETGVPSVQIGSYGCCGGTQCREMSEIECSSEYGWGQSFYPGVSCQEVNECEDVCCLPQCKDVPRNWCSPERGLGPDYVSSPCSQQKECEMGCCWLGGRAFQEQKAPCTSAGGQWSEGKCEKGFSVQMEAQSEATLRSIGSMFADEPGIAFVEGLMEAFGPGSPTTDIKMYIDAYTCEETVNSTWTGKLKSEITTCTSRGGCETKTEEASFFTIPFDEQGRLEMEGYIGAKKMAMRGQVTQQRMDYVLEFGIASPAEFRGSIKKGAPECIKEAGNKELDFSLWEE